VDINCPKIDWLTFTSWESEVFCAWKKWQNEKSEPAQEGKIKMYAGTWAGSTFVGEGLQGGKKHYIVRVSGEESHEAFNKLDVEGFKCTRIDIQITEPLPVGYSARQLADDLREGNWGSFERDCRLIENTDHLDTVYIGSGKSDRFARVYVKEGDEEKRYLRFEVEHKAEWAELIAERYKAGGSLGGVLKDFLTQLPLEDKQGVLKGFVGLLDDVEEGLIVPRKEKDPDATLEWLHEQVGPVLMRYLNDHEKGTGVATWLMRMVNNSNVFKEKN